MKRLLFVFSVLLLLASFAPQAEAQVKIATVDLGRVFTNYWKFKDADVAWQNLKNDLSTGLEDLKKSETAAREAYTTLIGEANNQVLSSEERDRRRRAAEDKLREMNDIRRNLEQYERQAMTRIQDTRMRSRENLLTDIYGVVRSRGRAGNYTLVLDSAGRTADQTPIVLYSSAEDITDAVLSQLNANEPARPPARR